MISKKELDEIRERLKSMGEMTWLKKYAPDDMQLVIFGDVPKLLDEVERLYRAADDNKTKKHSRGKT